MSYTLIGRDGLPYESDRPGALGGHRRARLYGRLDCPSALRAIRRGGYAGQRVFFADEATAVAAGYRPCAVCLPEAYRAWKGGHTEAELARVLDLVGGAGSVVLGHGRDPAATAAVEAFERAWDGEVLAVVDWPEDAASWLRPATRFTAQEPDAWVVAGPPPGWASMARRLRMSTGWDPGRTFGFASIAAAVVPAGPGTLEGLRGAAADGTAWRIGRNLIESLP